MFGKCKVCSEKDKRIADLQDQITHLRSMVYSEANPFSESLVNREADAALSGAIELLTVPESQRLEAEEFEKAELELQATVSERDRILSGTY